MTPQSIHSIDAVLKTPATVRVCVVHSPVLDGGK